MAALVTLALFLAVCALIALAWNRVFTPVPRATIVLLVAIVCAYEWRTLLTPRVELPPVGIATTQLAPWTHAAIDAIRAGDWPLWNRDAGCGAPLLANQQIAIFHPFTLLSFLLLPIGKAFTLTVALRLFTSLFFAFVLFRRWGAGDAAALFGAIAYTFSTFHVIGLLLPVALTAMLLPMALAAIEVRSTTLLTIALTLALLGGDLHSALWIAAATAAYAVYSIRGRDLLRVLFAFAAAAGLTAVAWMPAAQFVSRQTLTRTTLAALTIPNFFGTPAGSAYAGAATIALALLGIATWRTQQRPFAFFAVLMIAGIFTSPMLAIGGATACAVLALRGDLPMRTLQVAAAIAAIVLAQTWFNVAPRYSDAWWPLQLLVPLAALAAMTTRLPALLAIVTFCELAFMTAGYNATSDPRDVLQTTGAIAAMQHAERAPYRVAALGRALPPDTASYYGIEDIKSLNAFHDSRYIRLMRAVLGPDFVFETPRIPILNLFNLRYLYVPPGVPVNAPHAIYRGHDGAVFENPYALPRYFIVQRFLAEEALEKVVPILKATGDYHVSATVHDVPPQVRDAAPQLAARGWVASAPGAVTVREYGRNRVVLDVAQRNGWSLLVSSDVDWPGWRAHWNGARQPVVTVNGAFAGCFIPPGRGTLTLTYRPAAFMDGLRLSIATLIACAVALAIRKAAGRSSPARPSRS